MTHFIRHIAVGVAFVALGSTQSLAEESLPPLFANLPSAQNDQITERALATRISDSYPRDIGSSMLSTLLEMDGFRIEETETGVSAAFDDAIFPCINSYVVTWEETENGRVKNLHAERKQKCV